MLGGGVFVTQNKTLPGSYVNFVSLNYTTSYLGERGVVAIALPLGKSKGNVIELTRLEFVANSSTLLGISADSAKAAPIREIFKNANKLYIYDLGSGDSLETVSSAISAFESYEFNILCAYTDVAEDITTYITAIKSWRDELGKKCQLVVYDQTKPDYEGIINVVSTVSDAGAPDYALVAWVAGAEAGCEISKSCTNMLYNGEYKVVTNKTQTQLEGCINGGQIAFHLVYGEVRLLEDVNSLTTTSSDKGDDFKYNQTIRVIDQIANDIAKLFNTKFLGKIPNNASGRVSLWADIVAHHRELESIEAIENFDSTLLTVEQGNTKKSVVVNDAITVINSMAQLYLTVVVS